MNADEREAAIAATEAERDALEIECNEAVGALAHMTAQRDALQALLDEATPLLRDWFDSNEPTLEELRLLDKSTGAFLAKMHRLDATRTSR